MAKKNNKNLKQKLAGIQWKILHVQWKIITLSVAVIFLGFLLFATIIQYNNRLFEGYNQATNIVLFSNSFFIMIAAVTVYVFFVNLIISFFYSIPFSRFVKNQMEKLIDAATMFTRGKLSTRLSVEDAYEFSQLSDRFNAMAEHYEKQVNSLQKLLNENSILIEQAEQAASLEERRKLARDLHDAVSQQLFAISMSMAALPKLVDKNPEQAKQTFGDIERMVMNSQQELRALIMHLRPVELEGKSFREGIQALVDELKVKNKHLHIISELNQITCLATRIEDELFRIIQEAISNMLRHSKANTFEIKTFEKDERLIIVLEDNGVGFHVDQATNKGSYGLLSMKERMIELGGMLTILSYPNQGTKLELIMPLQKN